MVIEMYFAVNFSPLNYTYTISLAVHLKIINVDVPISVFGLTPPTPLSLRSPLQPAALKPGRPAGPAVLTRPVQPSEGAGEGQSRPGFGEGLQAAGPVWSSR